MKKITLIIFFFLVTFNVFTQNQIKIDSLSQVLETKITEKEKIDIYNLLAFEYTDIDSVQTSYYADKAIDLSAKINYPEGTADAYFRIGWAAMESSNYTKANNLYLKVLNISKTSLYSEGEANAYNGLGNLHNYQGNADQALEFFKKSLEIYKKLGDKKGQRDLYSNIGVLYKRKGDYTKALEYYFKALELAKELGHKKELAKRYGNIGLAYTWLGEYPKALEYNLEALKIFKELGDKKNIASILNNNGMIYYNQGEYPLALEQFLKSTEIKKQLGGKREIVNSLNNIGFIYETQGNYTEALKYFLECLTIHKDIGDQPGVAYDYLSVGNVYFKQKDFTKALDFSLKSTEIAKKLDIEHLKASNYCLTGGIYAHQKKNKEALKYLNQGLSISQKIGEKSLSATAMSTLGKIQYELKNYDLAKDILTNGISLAQEIGSPAIIRDSSEILAKVQKALGNHKAALESYQLYHATYDSLLGEEKSKQLSQLQIQYETEKKEQEIKSLAQQASIQSLELKQANFNKTIFGIVSVVLLLLGLVLYLVNRQKRLALQQRAQDIEQNLLRVQMNPHFIFNAMTSIQDYMNQGNAKQASLYLVKFSKLIRQVLDNSRSEFISLDQEINMLDNYLSIQNLKRDHPFTFKIEIEEDLDIDEIAIPPMFAQPFIENAIEHGVANIKEGATITIHFSMEGDHLVLKILDNGSGIEEAMKIKRKDHVSHAIKITEERIDLYRKMRKKKIAFDIQDLSQGTQVTFNLPFQYL